MNHCWSIFALKTFTLRLFLFGSREPESKTSGSLKGGRGGTKVLAACTVHYFGKPITFLSSIQESFEFKKPAKPASRGSVHVHSHDGKSVLGQRQNLAPAQGVSTSVVLVVVLPAGMQRTGGGKTVSWLRSVTVLLIIAIRVPNREAYLSVRCKHLFCLSESETLGNTELWLWCRTSTGRGY